MRIVSRLLRRLRTAIVFYRELGRYHVIFRRLPKQLQFDIAEAIAGLVGEDRAAEAEHTRLAALAVAAAASAEFARLSKCLSDPDRWRRLKPMMLIVVPLLDRHNVPHQFEWPSHDHGPMPEWARPAASGEAAGS